jgi:P4 family phage/plasmid primase-like protien
VTNSTRVDATRQEASGGQSTSAHTRPRTPAEEFPRLLDAGFWPVVIYPQGIARGDKITVGKEPIGEKWGLERWTLDKAKQKFHRFPDAGVGICVGPGRGPGGSWLIDLEGDGPEAEDSRSTLLGGEGPISTPRWKSARGTHEFYSVDPARIMAILPRMKGHEIKGTPSPGVYKFPELPGLEIRIGGYKADGTIKQTQSVVPPTVATDGRPRVWDEHPPVAKVPDSFYETLESLAPKPPEPEPEPEPKKGGKRAYGSGRWTPEMRAIAYLEKCAPAISGQGGHDTTFGVACRVGPGFDLEEATALRLIREHYNPRCQPPWTEAELLHKVTDAYQEETGRGWLRDAERNGDQPRTLNIADAKKKGQPQSNSTIRLGKEELHKTDYGNAERLARNHLGNVLYAHLPWEKWLIWDERRWKVDDTCAIVRLAKQTVRSIYGEAMGAENESPRKDLAQWAIESESRKRIDAMIGLARSEKSIGVLPKKLDQNPYLLNVRNGTIDLKTGELRPHDRMDLITKLAPVNFDQAAECPKWLAFLDRIMGGDQELVGFLQRAAGYALTGDVGEHCLFFLYGAGRNGKGTFLETILAILGDFATTVDAGLITLKRNEDHPTGLTDLDGRRFVATVEVDQGQRLAEALVKKLTGGDKIKARRMRQDYYEFSPTHKLWLAANHEPEIRGLDEGIWSRIKLIPFNVFIPTSERIKNLKDILIREEGPGILAWMVRGCLEWQRDGLKEPLSVEAATKGYRDSMDVVGTFIAERCNSHLEHPQLKTEAKTDKDELYRAYIDWATSNHCESVLTARKFGSEMESRGYKLVKSNSKYLRAGIKLKSAS